MFEYVDAHVHLWDLSLNSHGWLSDPDVLPSQEAYLGPYEAIKRDYVVADLMRDFTPLGLRKVVHVQADWDGDPVDETRWLQGLADDGGFPQAIVAFADLRGPAVASVLDRHLTYPNVRGIRMVGHYYGTDLLQDPAFLRGFEEVSRRGLTYDLCIDWEVVEGGLALARAYPETPMVLEHVGRPLERTAGCFRQWRRALARLAQAPNVAVKVSGLGMGDHEWTADSIKPWVLEAIEIFGPDRSMFGSNWPVDSLYSDASRLIDAYREVVSALSPVDQAAFFSRTAERIYRI
ncbi:MAG: amidohydrolase family protein [Candidatus Limnocylindrales bacterium]|jgi:predicted TIM-barrel fold metal-dependent hydrolase